MGMELRTAPGKFLINDAVGALDNQAHPHYGRVESINPNGYLFIREANGELFGPCDVRDLFHDVTAHVDYPHHPGTLYDCPGCEAIMESDESQSDSEPSEPSATQTGQGDAKTP